jgi:undecaprenyl-diphosphatase
MESSKIQFGNARLISTFFLGIFLPFTGFILLASHVWNQGKGFVWDIPVLQGVHQTARPILDTIALAVTPLGIGWGTVPVLTILGAILVYQRNWRSLLYLLVTPVGSFLLNRTLKLYFHRERPHLWEVFSPDLSYAFPSGHTMASASCAIVLIVLAWHTRWRWVVFTLASLFVLTIGWTRIYLGMHYPSDVLAGWLLAIAWSVFTLLIIQPNHRSLKQDSAHF